MHQTTSVVEVSNSNSFEDPPVVPFFEFLKRHAGISFYDRKVRLPDALPKVSSV